MSPPARNIVSYHINVGAGDSAIHILEGPKSATDKTITCYRAVLVDGGRIRAESPLQHTIKTLETRYGPFQFDAIVVTHWDADHYGGIADLLCKDFVAALNGAPGQPTAAGANLLRSRYLKYKDGKCCSTLYAPYWGGKAIGGVKMNSLVNAKNGHYRFFGARKVSDEFVLDVSFGPVGGGWYTAENVCKLCCHVSQYIGRELFTNLPGAAFDSPKSLRLAYNELEAAEQWSPGLFCIGGDGVPIAKQVGKKMKDKVGGGHEPDASQMGGLNGGLGVINENHSASNQSSIVCTILDPTGRPLHYFSGDAEHEMDSVLAKWINSGNDGFSIPIMKLSHHGSTSNNPTSMFDALKPKNMIISAGNLHGHPTWETIIYLRALGLRNTPGGGFVYATCWPSWFDQSKLSQVNTDNMGPEGENFRKMIEGVSEEVANGFWTSYLEREFVVAQDLVKKAKALIKEGKSTKKIGEKLIANGNALVARGIQNQGALMKTAGETEVQNGAKTEATGRQMQDDAKLATRKWAALVCEMHWILIARLPRTLSTLRHGPDMIAFILEAQPLEYIRVGWDAGGNASLAFKVKDTGRTDIIPNPIQSKGPDPMSGTRRLVQDETPITGDGISYLPVTDPIALWLAGPGLAATRVYMAKDKDAVTEVGGQFTLNGFGFSSDWNLAFSSTFNNGGAFGSGVISAEGGPAGGPSMLVMCLDPSGAVPQGINLEIAAQAFQFDFTAFRPVAGEFKLALLNRPEVRNAVWFAPTAPNTTFLRLEFEMDSAGKSVIEEFLHKFTKKSTIVGLPRVIGKKQLIRTNLEAVVGSRIIDPQLILECAVDTGSTQFNAILGFHLDYVEIRLQWDTSGKSYSMSQIPRLLEDVIEVGGLQLPDVGGYLPDWLGEITLREIVLTISGSKIVEFRIDFEAPANALSTPGNDNGGGEQVSFLLGYRYPAGIFKAALMTPTSSSNPPGALTLGLIPEYEKYLDIPIQSIVSGKTLATSVPLLKLIFWTEVAQQPRGINLDVFMLDLEFSSEFISFSGALHCDTDAFADDVPPLIASTVGVYAEYRHATKAFTLTLETTITLEPQGDTSKADGTPFDPVQLHGSFDYSDSKWELSVSAQELNIAALYSLMDPECSDSIMSLLQEIEIRNLSVNYKYDSGAPTQFVCGGLLILGDFELELNYKYEPKDWKFTAQIGATSSDSSVKKILQSVCPQLAELIPSFVDMPLPAAGGSDADGLEILRTEDAIVVFRLTLNVGNSESLTFLQLQYPAAGEKEKPPPPPTKRVVSFSMGTLPILGEIPLAGTILKPVVDELDFVWVHMDGDKDDGGLTKKEVDLLNASLPQGRKLRFKEQKESGDSDVLITTGFHFMVVDGGTVKLDYQFGHGNKPDSGSDDSSTPSPEVDDDSPPDPEDSSLSGDSVTTPMVKTLGPLSISNVGIDLNDDIISLKLDAKCKLGPIEFDLLGFSIGLDFSSLKLNDLSTLIPSFSIDGLAASFDVPPLELAGLFEKKGDTYSGGCILGMTPYTLMAVGSYGVVHIDAQGNIITPSTKPPSPPPPVGGSMYQSVFVFATLDGPLMELEFAEITGVKLGFGYNSRLVNPTIENIFQFPLLSDETMDATDPLAMMAKYFCHSPEWVINEQEAFWIAAGFTVIAFELLKVSVVAVMEFNPDLELVLLADAVASMPMLSDDHEMTFVFVELGIIAAMDFGKGTLQIDGQLSPNSFIFIPACGLTGGFALYCWFSGSTYAGDWVCTLGGYHVSYKVPSYYPTPQRLAISFRVDDDLSIVGDAYFALTPKVCMGGGRLSAVFTSGGLVAHFDAWTDFLINFNPFHYSGDIGVMVGVAYTIHAWIIDYPISQELSATLNVQGPPFSGVLNVDFCGFGFSCHFGAGASIPPPLTSEEFLKMLSQAPSATESGPQTTLVLESGLVPSKGGTGTNGSKAAEPWLVRAGSFVCRFQSKIPLSEAGYQDVKGCGSNTSIFIKPMHISDAITSMMNITVVDTETGGVVPGFRVQGVTEALPTSIWGAYSEANDPSLHGNNLVALLSGHSPTVKVMTGVRLLPPPAKIYGKDLPAFPAQSPMAVSQDVYTPEVPTEQPLFRPLPSKHSKKAWGDVKKVWGNGNLAGLVTAWEGAFGWDLSEERKLPLVTIGRLQQVYMAAPMVAA